MPNKPGVKRRSPFPTSEVLMIKRPATGIEGKKFGVASYRSKSDLVYEEIRRAIMERILLPGDRIDLEEVSKELNVSRMPVREAINRLQTEGLVDVIPHKEVTVASVTPDQIRESLIIRSLLEGFAIRQVARKITDEHIKNLRILCQEMDMLIKSGGKEQDLEAKNRSFHKLILDISGYPLIQSISTNLFDLIERFSSHFMSSPKRASESIMEHRKIVMALEEHDPAESERLVRAHIERSIQVLLDPDETS